jgi:hypothetical protein
MESLELGKHSSLQETFSVDDRKRFYNIFRWTNFENNFGLTGLINYYDIS